MNNPRILIIGATGQLGTDMCSEARTAGCEVHAVDFPQIDLADRESVVRTVDAVQPEYIINCAAFTAVDDCESSPEKAYALNTEGPKFCAEAAAATGARIIHISTDYVFDGTKKVPYIESDRPNPRSVYGKSKLRGEEKVAAACADHQIYRIAWLYGLHGKNFVYSIRSVAARKAAEGGVLSVVEDQLGTPTSTREVCRQILRAYRENLTGVFHATCEGACSWFDFARAIVAAADIPVEVQPCTTEAFPRPAPRPANSRLENMRLKESGLNCMRDWESAFSDFLRDEAAHTEV